MAERSGRYLHRDPKGNWLYRRAVPKSLQRVMDQKEWISGLGSHDRRVAEERWSDAHRECEAKFAMARDRLARAERRVTLAGPNAKDARRTLMWDAIARWLHEMARFHGGRLPLPEYVEVPTEPRRSSHAFLMLRGQFQQWARLKEPDAIEVLDLGDTKEGQKFFHDALIASYFVFRSMLELGPVGKN